jgi:hypothetical protein
MGEMRNTYKIFVIKCEGMSPFGRTRYRWEENFKINLKETGFEDMD